MRACAEGARTSLAGFCYDCLACVPTFSCFALWLQGQRQMLQLFRHCYNFFLEGGCTAKDSMSRSIPLHAVARRRLFRQCYNFSTHQFPVKHYRIVLDTGKRSRQDNSTFSASFFALKPILRSKPPQTVKTRWKKRLRPHEKIAKIVFHQFTSDQKYTLIWLF